MKKILLPTDFSEHAFKAIVYALQLFEGQSFQFYLFHAYTIPSSVGVLISVNEILEEEAAERLRKHEQRVMEKLGYPRIQFEKMVLPGSFTEVLTEVVSSYGIDLVVMGTKGAKNLAARVLGTYTSRVINSINCPLLVIPSDSYFEKVDSVVFATDHRTSKQQLNGQWTWVDWINTEYQPTFTQLHIDKPEDATGSTITPSTTGKMKPVPAVVVCPASEEVAYHEDATEGIAAYITGNNADIVVLVAHEYGWIGRLFHQSVTQQLAMRNLAPLLILRG